MAPISPAANRNSPDASLHPLGGGIKDFVTMNPTLKNVLIVLFVAMGISALYYSIASSMPRDTDPHQHYDIPDYYNGPMQPHGANKAPSPANGKQFRDLE